MFVDINLRLAKPFNRGYNPFKNLINPDWQQTYDTKELGKMPICIPKILMPSVEALVVCECVVDITRHNLTIYLKDRHQNDENLLEQ